MAGYNDVRNQAMQFWASRNSKQRTLLLAGVAVTAVLLALFVKLMSDPDYKPLFTGLESADAQTLTAQLDAEGIPHQASSDGKTISVPSNKLDAARLSATSKGSPHSGRMGFELFDKMSWGQTEFDQKVAYQRAMEGELEKTIETIGDIESARVHLVMATDSVFLDRQRAAKASVTVKLRGKGLPKSAVLAIARLVSSAVDGMNPENVSIVDADSARSLGLHRDEEGNEDGVDSVLVQRLVSTLEPIVGVNRVKATVNVDQNIGTREESEEKYDPTQSALLNVQRSEDSAGGAEAAGGVPGTSSNVPTSKQTKQASPMSTQGATQSSKTESAQYGVNKTVVHTMMPAGQVERISAAILVDDNLMQTTQNGKTITTKQKRSADDLAKIREIAAAAIGFDAKRGDTLSVENMSFDSDSSIAELTPPTWMEKAQKGVSDYSSIFRPVSLLILFALAYMFVVRPIQKQALAPGQLSAGGQVAIQASQAGELASVNAAELENGLKRAAQLKSHTADLVRQKPANTTQALQAWMHEGQS